MSAITRGIVLGQDGDELIIQATDAEVARFGKGSAVAVAQAAKKAKKGLLTLNDFAWAMNGTLYDEQGRPVCIVRRFEVDQAVDYIDATNLANTNATYVNGLSDVHYRIEAEGPV